MLLQREESHHDFGVTQSDSDVSFRVLEYSWPESAALCIAALITCLKRERL